MKVTSAQFICSVYCSDDLPKDRRPEITLLGRSNVGKSSVLNSLLNRRSLARIGSTPGRTRSINFYLVNQMFYMVDLPGYGYANVSEAQRRWWRALIEAYLNERSQIALAVLVIDARHEPTLLDMQMRDWLISASLPYVVALTKADKLSRQEIARSTSRACQVFPNVTVVPYSARTRLGVAELWQAIQCRLRAMPLASH
ncbi:MAG: ribosome biogenesis GTP-binding protein YihA/YsxC [Acidobacteriota bacterium]|nr:ribosome biogenesis GTP-binding protein YihA/YsxC [Blastocatellia bacterium]MDW8238003.1 ribosome biogenesis GTP-binding protein YihA/YsxC [Acidobacteriota bacterium]